MHWLSVYPSSKNSSWARRTRIPREDNLGKACYPSAESKWNGVSSQLPNIALVAGLPFFFALAALSNPAKFPGHILTIQARSLKTSATVYRAGNGCETALAEITEPPPFREEILAEAARIGRESYGPQSRKLILELGPYDLNRVPPEIFADALDDDGLTQFGSRLRTGLVSNLNSGVPYRATTKQRLEMLQRAIYLLKLNKLPPGLYTRRLGRSELTFVDDIFWGATLGFSNFWGVRGALAKHPTFEQLAVEVRPSDLLRLVDTPAMRKLTSLEVLFIFDESLPLIPNEFIEQLEKKGQFSALRRLRIAGTSNLRHQRVSSLLKVFRSAVNLEELRLDDIEIDHVQSPGLLGKLKSLELNDVFPPEGATSASAGFFRSLNPALHSLTWRSRSHDSFSSAAGQILNESAPAFTDLKHLVLEIRNLSIHQWLWLSRAEKLWENLETFHARVDSRRYPDDLAQALNQIFRRTKRLTSLKLQESRFSSEQLPRLFTDVNAPVSTLSLGVSWAPPSIYEVIGKAFPDLTALELSGAGIGLEDPRRIKSAIPNLRDLTGTLPSRFSEKPQIEKALLSANLKVRWAN